MDENKLMLLFLSNKLGTNDPNKILKYLKGLDKQKLQALAQEYLQWKKELEKQKTKKAAHGTKLQYIRSLKHMCPEGEELYYYKNGSKMDCGCKKKEQGGEVPTAKCGAAAKFKKVKKGKFGITAFADATGSQGGFRKAQQEKKKEEEKKQQNQQKEGWDKYGNYVVRKKNIKEREKQLAANKTEEETTPPKINKGIGKNACGSKMKKASCGCAVKKFKAKCGSKLKKHQLGGSLNGIPFMLEGTPKGGIVLPEYMYKKQIGYPSILPGRYTGLEKITPSLFLMFKTWVKGLPKSLSTSDKIAIGTGTVLGNVLGYDDTHNLNIRKTANKIANKVSPLIESSIEYRPFSADRLIESTLKPKKPSFKEFKK